MDEVIIDRYDKGDFPRSKMRSVDEIREQFIVSSAAAWEAFEALAARVEALEQLQIEMEEQARSRLQASKAAKCTVRKGAQIENEVRGVA